MADPSDAVLARSTLAACTTATLVTYPCGGPLRRHRSRTACRDVDGSPVLTPVGALVGEHLRRRPVVTIRLQQRGFPEVTVHGRARTTADGVRVDPIAVRLGSAPGRGVRVPDFLAARPDPLATDAVRVLAHLEARHGSELASCLRAHGVRAAWVAPLRLDRGGLDVLAVTSDGVVEHRLGFPEPATSLRDVHPAYRTFLACRCG